jgi:glycosyltransferase involved in cell wall biosynthesis
VAREPFVSVLTPVHDGETFLAECIESVLAQTHQNLEYIILDNDSRDGCLELARKYASRDRRIRVERWNAPVGEIERHNIAFRLISPDAKYCKVVSPEDVIFRECIARMVQLAEANPSVGMLGSYQVTGSRVRWQGLEYPRSVIPGVEICRRVFLGGDPGFGFGTPTSMLYRADLVRSSAQFYPGSSPHADASACFRYLRGRAFGFVFQVLSRGRAHERLESVVSAEMNRFTPAYVKDLVEYGPLYLSQAELRRRLGEEIRGYHRFLAASLAQRRGREFWDYHRARLEELGYPMTRLRLAKAGATLLLRACLNPGDAIAKSWRRFLARGPRRVRSWTEAREGAAPASRIDPHGKRKALQDGQATGARSAF